VRPRGRARGARCESADPAAIRAARLDDGERRTREAARPARGEVRRERDKRNLLGGPVRTPAFDPRTEGGVRFLTDRVEASGTRDVRQEDFRLQEPLGLVESLLDLTDLARQTGPVLAHGGEVGGAVGSLCELTQLAV